MEGRGGSGLGAYARAAGVVAATTAVAAAARAALDVPDVEMLFLLGVTVVAVTTSRGPSILAAALSVACYDFFFVHPSLTFDVEDVRYFLTFAMMFGIGFVISTLTVRLREEQRAATAREQRTAALYAVSRQLGSALDATGVASTCVRAAAEVLGAEAVLLAAREGNDLEPLAATGAFTPSPAELEVVRWAFLHGSAAGRGEAAFGDATVLCAPLRPLVDVLGVLAIRLPDGAPIRSGPRAFLDALCGQGGLALERVRLADAAREASLRAEAEALRSGLLSAVSHDLRTPLASITGAATILRDDPEVDPAARRDLLEVVCEEADRLERLVSNLLDMTRLESGAVQPRREWVPLVEIVGGALTRLERRIAARPVLTALPDDLPLLAVDPVLLEQLLLNLLENALKYTPPGSPIEIRAACEDGGLVVDVADRGPGLAPGEEERVFERFRRGAHPGVGGVGLGLAIARAIALAHGGRLEASRRPGGGALFRLRLPLSAPPPGEPAAEAAP